jgi:hypothetical protein
MHFYHLIGVIFEGDLQCPIGVEFFPLQEFLVIQISEKNLLEQDPRSTVDVLDIPIKPLRIWYPSVVQCVV